MNYMTPVKLRAAEVCLIEENIVQVTTAANYESVVEDVDEIGAVVKEMVGENKYYVLVITQQGSSSSHEAKTHAAQTSFRKNIVAEAIVISNIAIRLMATAYMKMYRPKYKIKLFNSKERALRWLQLVRLKEK